MANQSCEERRLVCTVTIMTSTNSNWDRSNPDEWHDDAAARHTLGIISLIIAAAAFAIVFIGGPATAPIVIPAFIVAVVLYGSDEYLNRRNKR